MIANTIKLFMRPDALRIKETYFFNNDIAIFLCLCGYFCK